MPAHETYRGVRGWLHQDLRLSSEEGGGAYAAEGGQRPSRDPSENGQCAEVAAAGVVIFVDSIDMTRVATATPHCSGDEAKRKVLPDDGSRPMAHMVAHDTRYPHACQLSRTISERPC